MVPDGHPTLAGRSKASPARTNDNPTTTAGAQAIRCGASLHPQPARPGIDEAAFMPAPRRRFLLVTNPIAGRLGRRLLEPVIEILLSQGGSVERCPSGIDAARAAVAEAARTGSVDAVIAAGGDGTFRAAAAEMLATSVPLGLVPLGTGNVLGHEIALPKSPAELARMLMYGGTKPLRAARANGAPFFLMAGVGFDGAVIRELDHALKHKIGKIAYVGPALRALAAPLPRLTVTVDGRRDEATWVIVANARCYGGRFVLVPHTHALDEGLHAVLFRSRDRLALMRQLLALAQGRLLAQPDVRMIGCRRVEIEAAPPVAVQIDGDAAGTTPLVVAESNEAVLLILPERV